MEDSEIVALYWHRDERAVSETDRKYGSFLYGVAMNLLGVREDAEECLSDTYQQAWNSMPEAKPQKLRAWLGRVIRNISIDLWRVNHAEKRYDGMRVMLSELDECVPSAVTVEDAVETAELGRSIDAWLQSLSPEDRTLFVRRYWDGEALNSLANACGIPPGRLAKHMYRLRLGLKAHLEKEGITL